MSSSYTKELIACLKSASVPFALLVEDDRNDALFFCQLLKDIGCAYEWVSTVREGIAKIQSACKFDIVFLDLVLPGEDWRDVYKHNGTTPVVIVSGHIVPHMFDDDSRWGHMTVMQKPVKESELRSVFATHNIRLPQ